MRPCYRQCRRAPRVGLADVLAADAEARRLASQLIREQRFA